MRALILIILYFFSQQLIADNGYRVELIVFENLYPTVDGERWDTYPGIPDNGNAIKLIRSQQGDGSAAFQTLDQSKLTLTGTYATLRKSSQYRPLGYLGWQQPSLPASQAEAVRVNFVNDNSDSIVFGNMKIRSSLYLHVDLDLAYSMTGKSLINLESIPESMIDDENFVARLTETRRIKLNEIHYFDHPLFAAIVRVVRNND